MGDHLNEREIVPNVESCRELNKQLLDYPQQRKDKETKLDFRRKLGPVLSLLTQISQGYVRAHYPHSG